MTLLFEMQKQIKKVKIARITKRKIMILPKCAVCNSAKSKFIKEQEASGLLLGSFGIGSP